MRHRNLVAMAFAGSVATAALAGAAQAQSNFINIGTAGIGGTYYPTGGYVCNLVNKSRELLGHKIRCTVESTAGANANLRSLHVGDFDVILTQSDSLADAWNGRGIYSDIGPVKTARFGFTIYFDTIHVVTRPDTGIKSFADLKGKIVNTANPGTGTEGLTYKALERYGVTAKEMFAQETKLTAREQAAALCDGKIDAFIYATGLGAATIQEAVSTCGAVIVPWYDETIRKMIEEPGTGYAKAVAPAGSYEGQTADIETWGPSNMVVLSDRLPEEQGYVLVKAVFENFEELKNQSRAYAATTRESAVVDGRGEIPYHAGALKYYREVGLAK